MRPLYDEFDELDGFFADSITTRHLLQEKLREERRHARRFALAAGKKRKQKFDDEDYDDNSYSDRSYD